MKLVVFDLDGTLNQTDLYAVPAHKKAMAEYGITNISDDFIKHYFGARATDSVRKFMPDADQETVHRYLKKCSEYENALMKENCAYFPGALESLKKLKQTGYSTAVCSNASARYINLVLNSIKLDSYIDHIQPLLSDMTKIDTLKILLDTQKPQKAVMVGDRNFDMEAARESKIPFIGCLYGFAPNEVQDADITISSADQIFNAVEELIG